MNTQTEPSRQSSEQDEIEAQLAASKRTMNILLLGIGGGVLCVMLYGIYQMVSIIIENS